MKTKINDGFPFNKLECQYYDICRNYFPSKCGYNQPCDIRNILRDNLESYVASDNLEDQVSLISEDR